MTTLKNLPFIILLQSSLVLAAGPKPIATSGENRVHLVELYSSESCSSCPPADKWASELKESSELWKSFVPVVFHVDYWNDLGWRDGFSAASMTGRQRALANTWKSPSVYTPAFVVDGDEWREWRTNSNHQFAAPKNSNKIKLSIFKNDDGTFTVRAEGLKPNQHFNLRAAQLGMGLATQVTSGENSGKNLKHEFVVLDWKNSDVTSTQSEAKFQFKKNDKKTSRLAIAAWVEESNSPVPLQAVGSYL